MARRCKQTRWDLTENLFSTRWTSTNRSPSARTTTPWRCQSKSSARILSRQRLALVLSKWVIILMAMLVDQSPSLMFSWELLAPSQRLSQSLETSLWRPQSRSQTSRLVLKIKTQRRATKQVKFALCQILSLATTIPRRLVQDTLRNLLAASISCRCRWHPTLWSRILSPPRWRKETRTKEVTCKFTKSPRLWSRAHSTSSLQPCPHPKSLSEVKEIHLNTRTELLQHWPARPWSLFLSRRLILASLAIKWIMCQKLKVSRSIFCYNSMLQSVRTLSSTHPSNRCCDSLTW